MEELLKKLNYRYPAYTESCALPSVIKDSIQLVSHFFTSNLNNKLCLVFPSKDLISQWITVPLVISLIDNDFVQFKEEIFEFYKKYKRGERLILNNAAIVEWVGITQKGVTFKTKGTKDSSGADITIKFADVIMLQKAPPSRKVLSSLKLVKESLPTRNITPTERLLNISTYGNQEFIKNSICLVGKYKSFQQSHENIVINMASLPEYFHSEKIDEYGSAIKSPLLISNNLSNLALHVTLSNTVSKIVIDGFSAIEERRTDFADIDAKNLHTILITDLSEINEFESIKNLGFEIFNFTKDNLDLNQYIDQSPFYSLENKLKNYVLFNVVNEVCENEAIENCVKKISKILNDESNNDLTALKIALVQIINVLSRVSHILSTDEILGFKAQIQSLDALFLKTRMWLGESHLVVEECISLVRTTIEQLSIAPSEKYRRFISLLNANKYAYVICSTESEAKALNKFLDSVNQTHKPKVISIDDVNSRLLSREPCKAILMGWPKSKNVNKLLSSFIFSDLTLLFYQFELTYFNSLQRRNRRYIENILSTIDLTGNLLSPSHGRIKGFMDLYSHNELDITVPETPFDIFDFEFQLDNAHYAKYIGKLNAESINAKRLDFDFNYFIYSSESHKLLVINELGDRSNTRIDLQRNKVDTLNVGDLVALINTDRDILVDLVEKRTNPNDLASIKIWTELWKNLLKEYYSSIGFDFKKLVGELRKFDCTKHEVTIKTWLLDEGRIGPDDDADLISIAMLTNSNLLLDNITKVRESITKMKGLRHEASEFIIHNLKSKIQGFDANSIINKKILVDGLGSVIVLKIIRISGVWENIDLKYVNKLLQKGIL